MGTADRERWDERYAAADAPRVRPPSAFVDFLADFPTTGTALDIACGSGSVAVWLALRGVEVTGIDVSTVAIDRACDLAAEHDVDSLTHFRVVDLDDGLPAGDNLDLIVSHRFWDRRLAPQMIDQLAPGGLLAVAALSEVGGAPGSFRASAGELAERFAELQIVVDHEADGLATLLARKP